MDQYQFIRMAHKIHSKSIRSIAKEFGFHRQTIRKALRGEIPEYQLKKPRSKPIMDSVKHLVDRWLEGDLEVHPKQRHTAKRVHRRLVEEMGFGGSESTVRQYVREKKAALGLSRREAMVPLDPNEGVCQAEVDWGDARVYLDGILTKVKLFCMRSTATGKAFVRAYRGEAQEMFLDGHVRAFAYFRGSFPVVVYDNLKAAVAKVLKGRQREEQRSFQVFRGHYCFEAMFCNPARGNEKGGVEGLVGFARRNYLVPIPRVPTMEALNSMLLEACEQDQKRIIEGREERLTIAERASEEQVRLIELPSKPYAAGKVVHGTIDKYGTVMVAGVRYSVPSAYARGKALIECGAETIGIVVNQRKVAVHVRVFDGQKWQLDPFHYLELIHRKVRAFDRARPLQAWRASWSESYHRLLEGLRQNYGEPEGTRVFLEVLMLHQEHEASLVETAVELALENHTIHLAAIKNVIHQLCIHKHEIEVLNEEQIPEKLRVYHQEPPNLGQYDLILEGGR